MPKSKTKNRFVAVLCGGEGEEREISLESGRCVSEALAKSDYEVITEDINSDNLLILNNKNIDVFFLALHGRFGEDGQLQEILESKKLKYTGSDSLSSGVAFNKNKTKRLLKEHEIATPEWIEVSEYPQEKHLAEEIRRLGHKYIFKPAEQGSSVGIEILEDAMETARAAAVGLARFGPSLVEEYIEGREVTVGIVGREALPLIEIVSDRGFYDYHAKYEDDKTEYLFDTVKDDKLCSEIQDTALKCFDILGCRHFARVDFLLDKSNTAYVLEVNTLPGMTSHSLLPKAAEKAGMDMTQLCERILELAAC